MRNIEFIFGLILFFASLTALVVNRNELFGETVIASHIIFPGAGMTYGIILMLLNYSYLRTVKENVSS